MKILFVANAIVGKEPGLSGGETRFIEIAKWWAASGHEIHLLGSTAGKTLCDRLGLEVVHHKMPDSAGTGRFTFVKKTLRSVVHMPRSLDRFDGGVVYSANEMLVDVVPALRLKLRGKSKIAWATVVHWLPPFPPWRRKASGAINSTLFYINERASVWLSNLFADVMLAVSPMTGKQLKDAGVNMAKVKCVECGVNYKKMRTAAARVEGKAYDAIFMKRLQAVKGIFDLVEIWDMVVRERPDARLLIVGEGIDSTRARDMVRQKGLEDNVKFAGIVYDSKQKIKYLAQSKLFLLPSHEENWAIAIGEAMACGTPVIAYGLEELIDVWQGNFISVPLGDKVAFARRVIEMLNTPSIANELSAKAAGYVKKYDWQAIAEKELDAIRGKA